MPTCILQKLLLLASQTPPAGDQDQLGDLLTRMFEETGKPANFAEPALPATVEHHQLMVELSNAVNYLMNQ